ncbi:50S ribosomal protein L24 [Candidatus Micrarchaeota archaeon]|nr:50S ribosomal protein L24 [Candidatus Micrarchaeota archaeon]
MKSDTERKKYYQADLHQKRNYLHVHLSKDLRAKLKRKKRAVLARKEDRVKIMRGPGNGKEGKIARVDVSKRKIFVEGITVQNSKKKEVLVPLEPSNLLLIALESTKERKELFSEEAFRKPEKKHEKKEEGKEKPEEAATAKAPAAAKPPQHGEAPVPKAHEAPKVHQTSR